MRLRLFAILVLAIVLTLAISATSCNFGPRGPKKEIPKYLTVMPFEAQVVPEEALYLPGQVVEVKLLVRNTSADTITMKPYPPEIKVRPLSNVDQILVSVAPGTQSMEIKPDDTITVGFTWDQKDKDGKQVPPGWYVIIFTNTDLSQGDMIVGINRPARVQIQ